METIELDNLIGDDLLPLFPESSDGTIEVGVIDGNFNIINTYENGSERDAYQFEITGAGTFDVELENLKANLDISIADSEGNTLYSSSQTGNESEFIEANFVPGIYTASITGEGNAETDYSLSITRTSSGNGTTSDNNEPILNEGDIVYRFLETEDRTQFYTTSETERDSVIANLSNYEYEGESFVSAPNPEAENDITGVIPIYRLFNTDTGVHLYTNSEVERDVVADLPNYDLEGISYYGYESQVEGSTPLYRLYNESLDAHFYTPSLEERNEFLASEEYRLEGGEDGITYYVQPIDI